MQPTRLSDDRLFSAHRQGKTSFYMMSTGEDTVAVVPSMVLEAGDMYRMVG